MYNKDRKKKKKHPDNKGCEAQTQIAQRSLSYGLCLSGDVSDRIGLGN